MNAAMNSAVSALQAQQSALSTVSDNLANSQTSGYKAVTTQFNSLLTEEAPGNPAGGVTATARQNILAQGLVQQTTTTTDMAITGNGMFAVSSGLGGSNDLYTRNGAFDSDSKGNLVLSGTNNYLLGWPTDAKGNVQATNPDNVGSLTNVNINKYNNSATATTLYSLQANLPAEAQSQATTLTYTNAATPPVQENLSIGYSEISKNTAVSPNTTTYLMGVTTSNPTATVTGTDLLGTTDVSTAGQPLLYKVTVDSSGNVTQIVDPSGTTSTSLAAGVSSLTLPTFLPSDIVSGGTLSANPTTWASLGTPFSQNSSMSVFDSLGVQQTFPVSWAAEGNNQWLMTVSSPTDAAGANTTGQLYDTAGNPVSSYSYNVSFNTDGTLESVTGLPTGGAPSASGTVAAAPTTPNNEPILSSTFLDGAQSALYGTSQAIVVNLGTAGTLGVGQTNGLSQYDTGQSTPALSVKATSQNGVEYGQLTGVAINAANGTLVATYNNGQQVPIYKIPVVTFPNENGLAPLNQGVYQQSTLSGTYTLNAAGTNGAGTITGEALESSNVNTSTEFSNMITAQQAYSAASQVIGTDKQMWTSLIQVVQ